MTCSLASDVRQPGHHWMRASFRYARSEGPAAAALAALGECGCSAGGRLLPMMRGDLVDERVGGALADAGHAGLAQVRVAERVGVPVGRGEALDGTDLPAELAPDA